MTLARRRKSLLDFPEMSDFFDIARLPAWPMSRDTTQIRVEEYKDNGDLVVRAEMPGVDPEKDVDITIDEGMLCISAERSEKKHGDEDGSYWSEFHYGSFSRAVRLPKGVSEKDISANYENGILEVRVPSPVEEETEVKKIAISHS